jgi:hypothetical protein
MNQARSSLILSLPGVKLFKRGTSTMSKFITLAKSRLQVFIGGAVLALGLSWPFLSTAQNKSDQTKDPNPHAQHQGKQPAGGQDPGGQKQGMKMPGMSGQKQGMGDKGMAHGEGGMAGMMGMTKGKMDAASMAGDGSSPGRGMMDDVDLMGMMDDDISMMGAVAIGGAGSKSMSGMGEMKMASSLPGVSRTYHIGATGFFLNHAEHLRLSTKQQAALNGVQRKALLSKFTAQRKIEEAEQELWELTGADEPDVAQIQPLRRPSETPFGMRASLLELLARYLRNGIGVSDPDPFVQGDFNEQVVRSARPRPRHVAVHPRSQQR